MLYLTTKNNKSSKILNYVNFEQIVENGSYSFVYYYNKSICLNILHNSWVVGGGFRPVLEEFQTKTAFF